MNFDKFFSLLGSIVILAGVTVVLTSTQTVGVIKAGSGGFIGALKAATLKG